MSSVSYTAVESIYKNALDTFRSELGTIVNDTNLPTFDFNKSNNKDLIEQITEYFDKLKQNNSVRTLTTLNLDNDIKKRFLDALKKKITGMQTSEEILAFVVLKVFLSKYANLEELAKSGVDDTLTKLLQGLQTIAS